MAFMSPLAVRIQNLGFTYPGQSGVCFSHLNLEVEAGDRFGLFGPNGAGKTTLMNCMTGLLRFKEGSIQLLGQEVSPQNKNIRNLFGFVPQEYAFYQELSPAENLEYFAALSGLNKKESDSRTTELLEVLGLTDVRNKPVEKFSGGMKRRVNLAIAVIHQPNILFLDEPTVGVDVQTRQAIISYLKELNTSGTTLVYTSHQLNEAEDLCNTVALIDQGKIIARNSLQELLDEHQQEGLEGLFINLTGKAYRDA